jgi:hypothetical protein
MFYQNYLDMRNTAHVTGGKPIAVRSQSISDVSAVDTLVAFYDIHGRKTEVPFFCSDPDTTRDYNKYSTDDWKYLSVSLTFHICCLYVCAFEVLMVLSGGSNVSFF